MKKLSIWTLVLLAYLPCFAQNYSVLNGDLNHDGQITVADVMMMNAIILEKQSPELIVSSKQLSYKELGSTAVLLSGKEFNLAIKKLVNNSAYSFAEPDMDIQKITFRKGVTSEGTIVSAKTSERIAHALFDSNSYEVTIYVDAEDIEFPSDCSYFFHFFNGLGCLDWNEFNGHIFTSNVTNMNNMFSYTYLPSLDLSYFETSNVTDMSSMFEGSSINTLNISSFDTSNVSDMSNMFSNCQSLKTLDLSNFDTSNVTRMSRMFNYCSYLNSLDLCNFDTHNVIDMSEMFQGSSITTLDISKFDTRKVTNMSGMFSGCYNITSLNLSSFDTSNVTNMSNMFSYFSNKFQLDLSSFNTCNVKDMSWMFNYYLGSSLDLSNFDTSKVTNMAAMFKECLSISNLKLGKKFIIADSCNRGSMCEFLANNQELITITCTAQTAMILPVYFTLDYSKIIWDIIE